MRTTGVPVAQYRKIGERIRFFREQAGMSQAILSERAGFGSPNTVFYIEQGERRVKVLDLVAIAKALAVTVDALLMDYVPQLKATSCSSHLIGHSVAMGSELQQPAHS